MEQIDTSKKGFFYWIQNIDVRYVYLFFFLTVTLFVLISEYVSIPMPIVVSPTVRSLYDKLEDTPADKLVIIESDWGVNIRAESEGQMRAIVHHLMQRKIEFAMLSWIDNPEGQSNGYKIISELAKEYGYEYGKEWVAWGGIKKVGGAELQALSKDIHGTIKTDINGTPIGEIPLMKDIKTIYDIYLIFGITYDYTWTPWLGFVQGIYGTNYAVGVSAITSSTAYSFIASGQMCGMLSSASGAAEYEELLGIDEKQRFAKQKVDILSMAAAYIVGMILLGNISYYSGLRRQRKLQR